eukprot:gene9783-1982_t
MDSPNSTAFPVEFRWQKRRVNLNDPIQPAGSSLEEVIQRLSEQFHPKSECKFEKSDSTSAELHLSTVNVAFTLHNFFGCLPDTVSGNYTAKIDPSGY